ncbi:hypothetical protein, partial [Sulfobacillus sp. hq2]
KALSYVHDLRGDSDAILVGVATIIADNPQLHRLRCLGQLYFRKAMPGFATIGGCVRHSTKDSHNNWVWLF